jgi:alpha-L-fucosidase 2
LILTTSTAALRVAMLMCAVIAFNSAGQNLVSWYNQPAKNWHEALPVGNGRLGAMIFGEALKDRLQLNEDSLWSGGPQDADNPEALKALPEIRELLFAGKYSEAQALANRTLICRGKGSGHGSGGRIPYGSYETLGDLHLEMGSTGSISGYRRELDLNTAVARVSFDQGGVHFEREIFSSFPDQVLVVRLTASKPGALSFRATLSRPEAFAVSAPTGDELLMSGQLWNGVTNAGVKYAARLKALNSGGKITRHEGGLHVENADSVTLLLAAATDYSMQLPDWRQGNPEAKSAEQLKLASAKLYPELRTRHTRDYQALFQRMTFALEDPAPSPLPTDERLKATERGKVDPSLIALYFQFGRYLMISSSRPGDLPANLQGLWADTVQPPWSADYHANINLQMIYWPAETANLAECFEPLDRYIHFLSQTGARTAQVHYGARGWTVHTLANAWGFTSPGEVPSWGLSPSAGAWLAQHLWEHFAFSRDTNFLRRAMPVLRGSAEFSRDWLVEDPKTGKLVAGPATSPENTFITADGQKASLCMGPAMEQEIVWDAFNNYLEAAGILGLKEPLIAEVQKAQARLLAPQVGPDGRLMEWSEPFKEAEPGHRHVSHLFALHPGRQITRQGTPALADAVRKSLDYRLAHGGGHTGWSRAWIINFMARLGEGDKAGENVQALIAKSTLPNLFDTHPPFQIDGNFGAVAGICEMLLQSHAGELQLLPALPTNWPKGNIRGLRARGACEVDLGWEEGKLLRVTLRPAFDGKLKLRYQGKTREITVSAGKELRLDGALNP